MYIAIGVIALLVAAIVILVFRLATISSARNALDIVHTALVERFRGILDAEAERERILGGIQQEKSAQQGELERLGGQRKAAAAEVAALHTRLGTLRLELQALEEESTLQSFGFYKPRYQFVDSAEYQGKLEAIRESQKALIKQKTAATCPIEWTVNGSKVEGRKQTNQMLNLMLRAFNGECDAAVAKVKFNNVTVMEERIKKAFGRINGLAEVQRCQISTLYLALKLQELFLAYEYQEKLQEEKDEQRRLREQMREEELAQRELEKARLEAEKDETRYEQALTRARQEVERAEGAKRELMNAQIAELQLRLAEARAAKERAISQAQLTRSGNVYIISNIGSFGENVYKIGMTRRLDPRERVRELSGAAVPFDFDIHAMIRSEDAPSLENKLHRFFHLRRMNRINERREFFRVTLDEILKATELPPESIEVTRLAEAKDFRKTLALIEEEAGRTASSGSSAQAPDGGLVGDWQTLPMPDPSIPAPSLSAE